MENNEMDKLFKERLKDFKESPDERVWKDIEASLEKKRKKRVVPFWWYWGGAAAIFVLLLYVINPFEKIEVEIPSVTDTKQSETSLPTNGEDFRRKETDVKKDAFENSIQVAEENKTEDSKEIKANSDLNKPKGEKIDKFAKITGTTSTVKKDNTTKADQKTNNSELLPFTNKEALASTIPAKQNEKPILEQQDEIDESIINKNKTEAESVVQSTPEDDKKSIFEAIDEQDTDNAETIVADQQNNGKWNMGPAVAPVYFAAMGEGSPIHSNFSSNSKSGNINLSYGLTVSYQLGNKLSVRSGIHKVDYGYDTEDVLFSSSLLASTNQLIDNINYSQTSRNLVVQSKAKTNALPSDLSNREVLATNPTLDGRMVQQLGYVEVPFELNYAILDAKFGLNIIGGVSSLFLVDNAVTLESNGLITEMGEANNVNNLNFSTNIGLGLNYQFTPKIQLSMEPIFKYQLNTFSETAGDFRPYSVGVYSGVRYKF